MNFRKALRSFEICAAGIDFGSAKRVDFENAKDLAYPEKLIVSIKFVPITILTVSNSKNPPGIFLQKEKNF